MKYAEEWHDKYRGISFSIRKWRFADMDAEFDPRWSESYQDRWNYYIYLFPEMFEKYDYDKFTGKKGEYGYNDYNSELYSLYWHCGCTYAKDLGDNCLKAGCDYSHLYDEGCTYELYDIIRDAKETIDSLFAQKPDLFIRCQGDGKYRHNSDFNKESEFSNTYKMKNK